METWKNPKTTCEWQRLKPPKTAGPLDGRGGERSSICLRNHKLAARRRRPTRLGQTCSLTRVDTAHEQCVASGESARHHQRREGVNYQVWKAGFVRLAAHPQRLPPPTHRLGRSVTRQEPVERSQSRRRGGSRRPSGDSPKRIVVRSAKRTSEQSTGTGRRGIFFRKQQQ
jgi:hypothetical protein